MKIFLLTAIFCYGLLYAGAQTNSSIQIKGIITDSVSQKPLPFATLALFNIKTGQAFKNYISKEDGSFEFKFNDSVDCRLVIAFTGYDNKIIPIKKGSADLGTISMKPGGKQMNEVT